MIKINFIPQDQRRTQGGLFDEGFGQMPREVFLGILIAAAGLLVLVHVVLTCLAVGELARQAVLQTQWRAMAADKKVIDDVTNETKHLQTKMLTLNPIMTTKDMTWGRILNQISDSVPRGLWLRSFRYRGTDVEIEGSSVSKARNEIIIVNNFVAALKECASLRSNFVGIDVDSIDRRDGTALSIADFSLKAKRKGAK